MAESIHDMVAGRVNNALRSLLMENVADEVLHEALTFEIEVVNDGVMVRLPNVKKPSSKKASAAKREPEAVEIETIAAEDGSENTEEAETEAETDE